MNYESDISQIRSITYRAFCSRLRKLTPGVTGQQLYREWGLCLRRTSLDYERIARKLTKEMEQP